eukprot:Amastigsp_a2425_43.p2 type:complete len:138 gc:universal Amastigsp_a2425_43:62-475(+)
MRDADEHLCDHYPHCCVCCPGHGDDPRERVPWAWAVHGHPCRAAKGLRSRERLVGLLLDSQVRDLLEGGANVPGVGNFGAVQRPLRAGAHDHDSGRRARGLFVERANPRQNHCGVFRRHVPVHDRRLGLVRMYCVHL